MSSAADWHVQDLLDWLHGIYSSDCKDLHNEVVSRQSGRRGTDYWRTSDLEGLFHFTALQAPLRLELTALRKHKLWFTPLFIHGLACADAHGLAAGLHWTGLTFGDQKPTRFSPNAAIGAKAQHSILIFNESLITSTLLSSEALHHPLPLKLDKLLPPRSLWRAKRTCSHFDGTENKSDEMFSRWICQMPTVISSTNRPAFQLVRTWAQM